MTGAINNLAASAAGAPLTSAQAGKAKKREEVRKAATKREDKFELHEVEQIEQPEAPRRAEDATQEQTREDHETHGLGYGANGSANAERRANLDLNA